LLLDDKKGRIMKNYEINNPYLSVKISLHGAELQSIKNKRDHYEYLWQGNSDYWSRRAPVLFPIVGKLKDDTYYINGKAYYMSQHGFARDQVFSLYEATDNSLSFQLKENIETLKSYPYNFSLIITYTLIDKSLHVTYQVKNTSQESMPFSIGGHPAFNMKKDSYLRFDKSSLESYQVTAGGIDKDPITILLDQGKLYLEPSTFDKDALIFKDLNVVELVDQNHSVTLSCDGFPYLGIWSKPLGAPFVCLEPWYGLGDLVNHDQDIFNKEGIILLEQGKAFNCKYTINFHD
jgi:galactose mutarotase-like enzyme